MKTNALVLSVLALLLFSLQSYAQGEHITNQSKSTKTTMTKVMLKGTINVSIAGELPAVGSQAPDFKAVKPDLSEVSLKDFAGKRVVLNIFPSVDTKVCATSVRRFNQDVSDMQNTVVLCISKDLPFAQDRFCGAEGINQVIMLSAFRSDSFERSYHAIMVDGPLEGLLSRAVVVIDENGKIIYTELVPEVTHEPNYEAALASLK